MEINIYDLSRNWFNWSFENPEKISPNHTALYFFCIEHCNRLGWKQKFGLPTTMAKEAIGIKSYNTYIKTLNDLVEWGFIKLIEKSKNQYSANIIALSNFNKAHDKALDKALIKHGTKQRESTQQSIDSIDIQIHNTTILQSYKITNEVNEVFTPIVERWLLYKKERRENYKTKDSVITMYKKLLKFSKDNPKTAFEIIDSAIGNNYSGFFEPKPQNGTNNANEIKPAYIPPPPQPKKETREEIEARLLKEMENERNN